MNTEDFLNVAKELARKAGDLCLELQNNLGDVRYKTVKDVVTIADVSSEKLIVDGLLSHRHRVFQVKHNRVGAIDEGIRHHAGVVAWHEHHGSS